DRRPAVVTLVHFGFDDERMLVRVDATQRVLDLLADGREYSLKFFSPAGIRFSVRQVAGRPAGTFWDRQPAEPFWLERGPGGAATGPGGPQWTPYLLLRRSRRIVSSASTTSSRDARRLLKLNFRLKALLGGRKAKT